MTCKYNSAVFGGGLVPDAVLVQIFFRTGEYKIWKLRSPVICVIKQIHPFLRRKSAKKQDIFIRLETELFDLIRFLCRCHCYTIADDHREFSVGTDKIPICVIRENDDLIRVFCGHLFAEMDIPSGKFAPFRTLPIDAMNRYNDLFAKQFEKWQEHAGTFRVDVDDICVAERTADG